MECVSRWQRRADVARIRGCNEHLTFNLQDNLVPVLKEMMDEPTKILLYTIVLLVLGIFAALAVRVTDGLCGTISRVVWRHA